MFGMFVLVAMPDLHGEMSMHSLLVLYCRWTGYRTSWGKAFPPQYFADCTMYINQIEIRGQDHLALTLAATDRLHKKK